MIGGLLLVLFALIYIDLIDEEKRRKKYENYKKCCKDKKVNGTLEFERACEIKSEIETAIKSGKKLSDICKENNIEVTSGLDTAALYIAHKAMIKDGYTPCLRNHIPLDKNFHGISYYIKGCEDLAMSMHTTLYRDPKK